MLALNKVYLGDCYDLLPQVDNESIDLIILDPPYLVTGEKWDQKEQVTSKLSEELFRVGKQSSSLYVWCSIGEKDQPMIRWLPIFNAHWHFKDMIVWKKQRGIGMKKGWLFTREEVLWYVKNNNQFVWNQDRQYSDKLRTWDRGGTKSPFKRITNVWTDILENDLQPVNTIIRHYTPKPVKAIERIISLHTNKGDIVLDPMCGSGTTGVCCKHLQRNYILMEKDPDSYEESRIRIANEMF